MRFATDYNQRNTYRIVGIYRYCTLQWHNLWHSGFGTTFHYTLKICSFSLGQIQPLVTEN